MLRLVRLLAVACLLLAAAVSGAAPFTSALDALRADLQSRRDNDFGGTLTAAQRRQLAAVEASLARIDGAHASVEDDAKTLKFVAKKLARPFRAELDPSDPGPLAGLLGGAGSALLGAAESEYGTLDAAIAALADPALVQDLQAIAAEARAALDAAGAPGATAAQVAAAVRRAARAIARGLLLHADATAEGIRCKMRGRFYSSTSIDFAHASESAGVVTVGVNARMQNPVTGREEVFVLSLRGTVGAEIEVLAFNPFFPLEPNIAQFTEEGAEFGDGFYPRNGECFALIQSWDPATGTAAGTFTFQMQANPNIRLPMTKGSFRLRTAP
ncbi:MAG: hypothetical protein HMLKMBBP_00687 [Planctomycetes bacterium]|nr:hypothetical protein [Planctomycetota bacterium]